MKVGWWLLAARGDEGIVAASAAAHVDAQALDFLVERGERNHKALRRFGLVPAGALEHVSGEAAFALVRELHQPRRAAVGRRSRTGSALGGRQRPAVAVPDH